MLYLQLANTRTLFFALSFSIWSGWERALLWYQLRRVISIRDQTMDLLQFLRECSAAATRLSNHSYQNLEFLDEWALEETNGGHYQLVQPGLGTCRQAQQVLGCVFQLKTVSMGHESSEELAHRAQSWTSCTTCCAADKGQITQWKFVNWNGKSWPGYDIVVHEKSI